MSLTINTTATATPTEQRLIGYVPYACPDCGEAVLSRITGYVPVSTIVTHAPVAAETPTGPHVCRRAA